MTVTLYSWDPSLLLVANHASVVLYKKLDGLEEYSCHLCLVIEVTKSVIGIRKIIKSPLQLPDISEKDVDKCHRTDLIDDDGKQNIVRAMTKHSTTANVFRERWSLSKLISWKEHATFFVLL